MSGPISVENTLSLLRQQGPCTAKEAMCGPFPRSNWVIPGMVCIGPAPQNPLQDGNNTNATHAHRATVEDLQTLIDCGFKKFVDLRGRTATFSGKTYLQNPELMDVTEDMEYAVFEGGSIGGGGAGSQQETGAERVNKLASFLRHLVAETIATERPVYIHGENGMTSEAVAACGILAVAYGMSGLRACSVASAQHACRENDEGVSTLIPNSMRPFIKEVCIVCANTSPLMYDPNESSRYAYSAQSSSHSSPLNNHRRNSSSMPGVASQQQLQQQQQQQPLQNYDPYSAQQQQQHQQQQDSAMQPLNPQASLQAIQNMTGGGGGYGSSSASTSQQATPYGSIDPENFQNPLHQQQQTQQQQFGNSFNNNMSTSTRPGTSSSVQQQQQQQQPAAPTTRFNRKAGASSGGGVSSITFGGDDSSTMSSAARYGNSSSSRPQSQQQQQQQQQPYQQYNQKMNNSTSNNPYLEGQQAYGQPPQQTNFNNSTSNNMMNMSTGSLGNSGALPNDNNRSGSVSQQQASFTGHSRARIGTSSNNATASSISWGNYGDESLNSKNRVRNHQQMQTSPTPIKTPFNSADNQNQYQQHNQNQQQQPLQFMNPQQQQQYGNNGGGGGGFSAPPPLASNAMNSNNMFQQQHSNTNSNSNSAMSTPSKGGEFLNYGARGAGGSNVPSFHHNNPNAGDHLQGPSGMVNNTMQNFHQQSHLQNQMIDQQNPYGTNSFNSSSTNNNNNNNGGACGGGGDSPPISSNNNNNNNNTHSLPSPNSAANATISTAAFPPQLNPSNNADIPCIRGPTPTSNWVIRGRLCCGAMPHITQGRYIEALGKERFAFLISLREVEPEPEMIEAITEAAGSYRPQVFHFPLKDGAAFANNHQAAEFLKFVRRVVVTLEREPLARAYVFCQNGHGRTGMFVSTALALAYGLSGMRAVNLCSRLHEVRMNSEGQDSPQTHEQRTAIISLLKG